MPWRTRSHRRRVPWNVPVPLIRTLAFQCRGTELQDACMAIFRLGHVEVRTPDLELCAAYYTEVLGLREVARDDNHVYLKGWDEQDHHSLMLTGANRYGLEHVA